MNKDQRYSRIERDDYHDSEVTGVESQPYRDDPRHDNNNNHHHPRVHRNPLQRSQSSPLSTTPDNSERDDDSTMLQQRNSGDQSSNSNNINGSNHSYKLRMRRAVSPAGTRSTATASSTNRRLPMSREGSSENIVILEGLGHIDRHRHSHGRNGGSITSPPRPARLNYDKHKNSDDGSLSLGAGGGGGEDDEMEDHASAHASGSREDDGDALFCASHGSSFDLLDDEDEIAVQRYHRDYFGASPYQDELGTSGWDPDDDMMMMTPNMYHPRTESTGSNSKDPWIRMVQQQQQQSPTNGIMPFSAIHSISDLLLYLRGVRRQARQRRAQRLLTMPSEQWFERLQFCFMTYCWDATDVGLLVVAILLVVWFFGLLWLAKIDARATAGTPETQNTGAEYNANAEFDTDYETKGGSWRLMFQWWWWGLGFVLLVRILGPFAVQNVNNRRREIRRQRFMSGNMHDQQRRMHQQQLPTIIGSPSNGDANTGQQESSSGVEITETNGGSMV
ncbi:expressed unknown protein [Seminavis robusta]|uniref:Uncharacterized protein n=1 Tax=Seminavis robusta TaxID=568900 RepID=A0A9N8DQZ9_9STRA|nr:expressed unknown protein [Seminavis robusta]|eukprot:Sro194_g082890.1 n/a (504) ;mRNA; r:57189-58700